MLYNGLDKSAFPFDRDPVGRWLCISYAFPPIARSGTHRTLGFVRHLADMGWPATVIASSPQGEPTDDALRKRVPGSTRIIRVPHTDLITTLKRITNPRPKSSGGGHTCDVHDGQGPPGDASARLREFISQLCITPDSRLGWALPAARAGLRAMRQAGHDVIFSTSPYASAHLAAWIVATLTRRPWVADFRDPWIGNPFRLRRMRAIERWDGYLERRVMRRASHLVFNTPTLTAHMRERYPLIRGRCTTILNGFDADVLNDVVPIRCAAENAFVLTHTGQFYGPRRPHPWFKALRVARERAPRLAARTRLALVGPDYYDGTPLREIARLEGVDKQVLILGLRPHAEALGLLAGSDAVMLAGAAGVSAELQVPNKLFEYLALRKPILAAIDLGNPAVGILRDAHANACICPPGDPDALADGLLRLAAGDMQVDANAWSGVDRFERRHGAQQLRNLFEDLTPRPGPHKHAGVPTPRIWKPASVCTSAVIGRV